VRCPEESWELELHGQHLKIVWNGGSHFLLQHPVEGEWSTCYRFKEFGLQNPSQASARALKHLDKITSSLVTPSGKLSPIWKFDYGRLI